MDHFRGITPQERYDNDVLNELRQIRQLLERNREALEPTPIEIPQPRRGRQKRSG